MRTRSRVIAACALTSPLLLVLVDLLAPGAVFPAAMGLHAVSVLVAAGAMYVMGRHGDPRLRRARLWFAAALGASASGFVIAGVHTALVGHVDEVSVANLAPVLWVPCALAGLFAIPSETNREGGRLRAGLDALVVTVTLGMVFWMLFLEPMYFRSDRTGAAKAVLLAYPVFDLVLAVVAFALAAHARADVRRFLHVITVGLLLVAVSDAGSAALVTHGVEAFNWTNVVLQAGLATLLCAALLPTAADLDEGAGRLASVVDGMLPHIPILAAVAAGLHRSLAGRPIDSVVVTLGSIMVLGLAMRQLLYASHLSAVAHRLSADATRDSLTGLANRRSGLSMLETKVAELPPGDVAVVLLDLDGFKEVNDTFGHAAGDVALVEFAHRLATVTEGTALSARLGGDEFALLLSGQDAEIRAVTVADALTGPQRAQVGAVAVPIGASAGIAVSRAGDTASALLRRADLAMYEAKHTLLSRAAVFTDDMAARAERRHLLTQALSGAAERGELALVYQPLIRLEDGGIAGAEALLRWNSPLHGVVPPLEFVPLAEETGVILELGAWVLDEAARQMSEWAEAGRPLPRLLVNVSPHQLTETFAAEAVRAVLAHGVTAGAVTIEITESAMTDLHANRCLMHLREAGFSIAMDDFGAGFSSLAQLAVLPVDTLKFDREFIRGVSTPNGRRIVNAIIALARDLGLTTVAEGVECAEEADVVRQAGCALAQGYHFATPLTAEQMREVLPHIALVRPPLPRTGLAAPTAGSCASQ